MSIGRLSGPCDHNDHNGDGRPSPAYLRSLGNDGRRGGLEDTPTFGCEQD
jgi:hypothetical protein